MTDPDIRRSLAEAALARAAAKPWAGVTLHELAGLAHRPVADFYPLSPADAFDCLDEYFDRAAAADMSAPDASASPRDRLFDAVMRRFEAMEPHRAAILAIDKAQERDPLAPAASFVRTLRSARWLLALAASEGEGAASSAARAQSLALVLGETRRAWTSDTGGEFAKTMAALDRGLRRSEAFFEGFGKMAASFKQAAERAGSSAPTRKPTAASEPREDPPGPMATE